MTTSLKAIEYTTSNPTTPTQRSRHSDDPAIVGGFDGSPTSTFSPSISPSSTPSHTSFRNRMASASMGNPLSTPNLTQPERKLYVRSDAALLTCFDPADKELYDLWAPKR